MTTGKKNDAGKLRFDLIPPFAERAMTKVLTNGAEKYGPDDWRRVPEPRSRYVAALLRHLNAWRSGEVLDPEWNLPHLAHAMCCLAFLSELEQLGKLDPYPRSEGTTSADASLDTICENLAAQGWKSAAPKETVVDGSTPRVGLLPESKPLSFEAQLVQKLHGAAVEELIALATEIELERVRRGDIPTQEPKWVAENSGKLIADLKVSMGHALFEGDQLPILEPVETADIPNPGATSCKTCETRDAAISDDGRCANCVAQGIPV